MNYAQAVFKALEGEILINKGTCWAFGIKDGKQWITSSLTEPQNYIGNNNPSYNGGFLSNANVGDWEVFKPKLFLKDLKHGDKFRFTTTIDQYRLLRIEQREYYSFPFVIQRLDTDAVMDNYEAYKDEEVQVLTDKA